MSDKPKKPKAPKLADHPLFPNPHFNCRSSSVPLSMLHAHFAQRFPDERKPWIQLPNACVVPSSGKTSFTIRHDGKVDRDTYIPSTAAPDQVHLVAAVYAANHWLANFCAHARANYPMGVPND